MGSEPENRLRSVSIAFVILLAAGALLSAINVWADSPDARWQFFKPVILPDGLLDDQLVEVELDPEVYPHARPGLGDVRLTATDTVGEREIPYKLLVEAGDQRRAAVPGQDAGSGAHSQRPHFIRPPGAIRGRPAQ